MPIKINNAQTRAHMLRKSYNPVEKINNEIKLPSGEELEWTEQIIRPLRYQDRLMIQKLTKNVYGDVMYHYKKGSDKVSAIVPVYPKLYPFMGNQFNVVKEIPGFGKLVNATAEERYNYIVAHWSDGRLLRRTW